MVRKLTIKLSDDVLIRAKSYAKKRKTSLSKLIESYLNSLTQQNPVEINITPLVKSLSGVITIPENSDYKKYHTD